MKLFLASEVKHPTSFQKLEAFVGGFNNKTIAYIPTAGNGEGWGSWREGGSWQLVQTLGANVKLIQLEDYIDKDPAEDIKNSDMVWFSGGQCGYLMYWIRRTQLDKKIKNILDNGTIYIGSSAGSMITAKTLDIVEWYIGENEHGAGVIPGLNLVDFDIYPHYEDHLYDQIKEKYSGNKLYLLKNGEAVIIVDEKVTVFGEERIIL